MGKVASGKLLPYGKETVKVFNLDTKRDWELFERNEFSCNMPVPRLSCNVSDNESAKDANCNQL